MNVLLINPPIYDFAAHDFWLKPYGLIHIAGILKKAGVENLYLFDFMDRSLCSRGKTDMFGRGKFCSTPIKKPAPLKNIPRNYKRYGAPLRLFIDFSSKIPKPDFVLVSTGMTYWYPGVIEVVKWARILFPESKVILGGTYSSILRDHARKFVNPDHIFRDIKGLFEFMEIGKEPEEAMPLWDLYHALPYGVVKLTDGCPFRCTYCAVWILSPGYKIHDPGRVFREIMYFKSRGIENVAFYDDALLVNPARAFLPLLDMLKGRGMRFHTPNALHARFITSEVARAMRRAGFQTIYIGYETSDPIRQKITGGKVTRDQFHRAVDNLLSAGFKKDQITVYLLMGLPGQPAEEVEEGMYEISKLGLKIMLSEYSPIPGTPDGERAREILDIDEPLLQNNIVFPIAYYGYETVKRLKALKNRLNSRR